MISTTSTTQHDDRLAQIRLETFYLFFLALCLNSIWGSCFWKCLELQKDFMVRLKGIAAYLFVDGCHCQKALLCWICSTRNWLQNGVTKAGRFFFNSELESKSVYVKSRSALFTVQAWAKPVRLAKSLWNSFTNSPKTQLPENLPKQVLFKLKTTKLLQLSAKHFQASKTPNKTAKAQTRPKVPLPSSTSG